MSMPSETTADSTPKATAQWLVWLSLALVLLVFGAMLLAQVAVRFLSPSLFGWGSQFLPSGHGVTNTVVLILSCLPIAAAGGIAARSNRWLMIAALSTTFVAGVMFLAVQSVEYENSFRQGLGWGAPLGAAAMGGDGGAGELGPGDVSVGRGLWQATCRSCHGVGGEGVEGQGKDLRSSEFLRDLDDPALLAFIRAGRPVADPLNTTGKPMPPKGGNPLLKGPQLMDVIAYIRTIQIPIEDEVPPDAGDEQADDEQAETDAISPPGEGDDDDEAAPLDSGTPEDIESGDGFWIPSSSLPLADLGPSGLSADAFEPAPRPVRAGLFFAIFLVTTGVHAIQVLIGLSILLSLIYRAVQIPYRPSHDLPLKLVRNYWFLAVAIWVFLFPMFYLIQ